MSIYNIQFNHKNKKLSFDYLKIFCFLELSEDFFFFFFWGGGGGGWGGGGSKMSHSKRAIGVQ